MPSLGKAPSANTLATGTPEKRDLPSYARYTEWGFTKIRDPNKDSRRVGFLYNQNLNKVPLTSETPKLDLMSFLGEPSRKQESFRASRFLVREGWGPHVQSL